MEPFTPCNDDQTPDTAEMAHEMLAKVLCLMDADLSISVSERDGRPLLSLTGKDEGIVIGRHGETLRALQMLISTMVQRRIQDGRRADLLLDVDDYLLRRQLSLTETALDLAEQAVSNDRAVRAKPMNAQDRRAIHIALRDDPRVTTHSDGTEEQRHVVISPDRDVTF